MSILKAVDICKSYAHDGHQTHVLSHLHVSIQKEDFTVIMGRSGSGKSTLLYALSGMDTITSGEVFFHETPLHTMKEDDRALLRRKDFGFVFQQIHLLGHLSLQENIAICGHLVSNNATAVEARCEQLLTRLSLSSIKTHLPSQCSGGEAQRAGIGRALINQPEVVFADEPTGALNSKMGNEILDILSELHQQGQSIVMVTHDIKAALRATRILYLQDGNIVKDLRLPIYQANDMRSRETQIIAWLTSMGW